jgi:RNA-binding protein YhbY
VPIPELPEVTLYSKSEGVLRQSVLHELENQWEHALVKTQFAIAELKTDYLQTQKEIEEKVSQQVESRLTAFVGDMKGMQR